MIADGNHIELGFDGFLHQSHRVHIKLGAGREASMNMQIAVENF
jgi:hypothetical protein